MIPMPTLPDLIHDEEQLDDWLTTPSAELVAFARTLRGPLVVVGVGGKMGPSLAVRAARAIEQAGADAHVVATSRFSDPQSRRWLQDRGVETIVTDALRRSSLDALPETENVIYLVGTKFGTRQNPSHTWAVNTLAPSHVLDRYPQARFVALSTGNVYPFTPVDSGGSLESDMLGPVGEYANAAVGRERIFDYCSRLQGTPVTLMRLNYATDLRYGVVVDLAKQVAAGDTIDVTQGYFNCIWQGDANDLILRSLSLVESPPKPLNVTSLETLSVREVCQEFGRLLDRRVEFTGYEAPTALLSNASECSRLLGRPATPVDVLLRWTAHWIVNGGRLLDRPTHFEVRDGGF